MLPETKKIEEAINDNLKLHVALSYYNRLRKMAIKGKLTHKDLDAEDMRVLIKFKAIAGLD